MADLLDAAGSVLSLTEIAEYHEDVIVSLRRYFGDAANVERFLGYSPTQVAEELKKRIDETSFRSMLITLASIEASFRVDYEFRCQKRLKDDLSRAFRKIYKARRKRVALDEHILEAWRTHVSESKAIISELRSAFKLRHWLAHGRYWQPKFGRTFDFDLIYDLAVAAAEDLFNSEAST